jgi:hypothetical protein
LIVTDWTGAMDGPFALRESKACPSVPDRAPAPVTTSPAKNAKSSQKSSSKQHTTHASKSSAR